MCYGCWEESGKVRIVNEAVLKAVEAVKELYEVNCVGGGMHIVTDDWNCEDGSVAFCREFMSGTDYKKTWNVDPSKQEWDCLAAFEKLSEDERISALAIHRRFV